jgi:transposase
MPRPQRKFSEEQKLEIRSALKESKNIWEQKRLMMLNIRAESGASAQLIAQLLGCSKSSVEHVIGTYFLNGLSGIAWNKQSGNRRNLSMDEEKELLNQFKQQAEQGHMLVVKEIKQAYVKKLGRSVPNSTIYRMLKRHGWRKIMPRSKHPKKASDEAIEAYKKNH